MNAALQAKSATVTPRYNGVARLTFFASTPVRAPHKLLIEIPRNIDLSDNRSVKKARFFRADCATASGRMVASAIDYGRFGFLYIWALGGGCVMRSLGFDRLCPAASRPASRASPLCCEAGRPFFLARAGASRYCRAATRAPHIRCHHQSLPARRSAHRAIDRCCDNAVPARQRRGAYLRPRRRRRLPARGLDPRRHRTLQRGAWDEPCAASACAGLASAAGRRRLSQLTGFLSQRFSVGPPISAFRCGYRTIPKPPACGSASFTVFPPAAACHLAPFDQVPGFAPVDAFTPHFRTRKRGAAAPERTPLTKLFCRPACVPHYFLLSREPTHKRASARVSARSSGPAAAPRRRFAPIGRTAAPAQAACLRESLYRQ